MCIIIVPKFQVNKDIQFLGPQVGPGVAKVPELACHPQQWMSSSTYHSDRDTFYHFLNGEP